MCYHRGMRFAGSTIAFLLALAAPAVAADPPDPLVHARQHYNLRQFAAALSEAEQARLVPAAADSADLIAARAYLELFRTSGESDDLTNARDRLRRIDPTRLAPAERVEFLVGLGEALYFDGDYGAAADVFEPLLARPNDLMPEPRELVLDWWASALDRDARPRSDLERTVVYRRIRDRMKDEIGSRPASVAAAYWLAAAARGQGDVQAAWDAAQAAWVRAPLASGGAALRADLDRLVLRGLVPDRARVLALPPEALRLEWERFKERWAN